MEGSMGGSLSLKRPVNRIGGGLLFSSKGRG